MTDEILRKANDNRRHYDDYDAILNIVREMAGSKIRIIGSTGSFDLPPQLNGRFIELMTNYLNDEMTLLNKEYKEM